MKIQGGRPSSRAQTLVYWKWLREQFKLELVKYDRQMRYTIFLRAKGLEYLLP